MLGDKDWLYLYLRVIQQNRSHTGYFNREILIWVIGGLNIQIRLLKRHRGNHCRKHLPSQGYQNKGKKMGYQNPEARRNPTLLISSLRGREKNPAAAGLLRPQRKDLQMRTQIPEEGCSVRLLLVCLNLVLEVRQETGHRHQNICSCRSRAPLLGH